MRAALLLAAAAALAMAYLCLGRDPVTVAELWEVAVSGTDANRGFMVLSLRLPRLLVAAAAGAGLGLGGAVCQSLLRNPLASPDVIGVTAGASLGAVTVVLGLGAAGTGPLGAAATGAAAGALAAGGLVLALARGAGTATLILAGIGVGLLATALAQALLVGAGDAAAGDAMLWLTGTVNGAGWAAVRLLWTAIPVLGALALALRRPLAQLELGDDMAAALGTSVARARLALLALAGLLCSAAVAMVGPVAFVSLMAGPAARAVLATGRPPLLGAALVGGAVLVAADFAARLLAPVALMPAGIFTGLLGAPWLVWLLRRQIAREAT